MGIYNRGTPKNPNWWISYFNQGERIRERGGPTKRIAEAELAKKIREIAEGRAGIRSTKHIRFDQLSEDYLNWSENNKRSHQREKTSINKLNEYFGSRSIHGISPKDIEDYKNKRKKDQNTRRKGSPAPATINRELACLRHMFNKAIEWKMLTENPFKGVKLFREENMRRRYLTHEEEKRLLENCAPHIKPIIILALNTGMRRGEILNLAWDDIDLKKEIILVRRSKTGESREIPMNENVREELKKIPRQKNTPHIFVKGDGTQLKWARTAFENACRRSKINDLKFHDLRHTFGSRLVEAGVDLRTIMDLLGHKTITMTLRYSHISPQHKKDAVSRLVPEQGEKVSQICHSRSKFDDPDFASV